MTMIDRRNELEPEPVEFATPVASPSVHEAPTPASVVGDRVLEVEERLTQLLKDRAACEAELVKFRERAQMREHERADLDRQIAVHRQHVAAWRQAQLFIDLVDDGGPGSVLAAALAPGQPQ